MAETVFVVGGGLAGLVAARRLAEEGVGVRLFERRGTVGGRVRSTRRDGFVLDRGFQVLFTAYPAVRRELDLDALDAGAFTPGATIAREGRRSVLADPVRAPGAAVESLFNREATLADKLRVLWLRRALRRTPYGDLLDRPDASIRELLRDRGFSERFVERFAAPFYGGITLDRSLGTSRLVFEYTFKALSEGRVVLPAEGMGAIPEQLAAAARDVGARIETDRAVTDVTARDDGVSVQGGGEAVAGDAAVVATDPPTARDLTGVASIPTAGRGCVTQYYALPRDRALDGARRLVLNADGSAPNHVAPLSAVQPSYAPEGRSLLSATFLGQPDATDAELAGRTRAALESWYPEHGFDDLDPLRTDRIAFAQFDQQPGVRDGLPAVDAPDGPVVLAGDYTRWSSIQGAMESGRRAAVAVREAL